MRVLNLLGVYLGPESALKPAAPANPTGFWEHEGINRLNERILSALGGSRREPPALPPDWASYPAVEAEREAAQALFAETFGERTLWGWKDTSNSLALPFWQQLLTGEVRYVLCIRNPLDVTASLGKGFSPERVLDLWPTYMAAMLAHTAGLPRILVAYADWFGDRRPLVERLARFVEQESPLPGSELDLQIEQLIDDGLRHHRSSDVEAVSGDRLPLDTASLYLSLGLLNAVAPECYGDPCAAELHAEADLYATRLLAQHDGAEL